MIIVGIGSSAGGLEALQAVLPSLPVNGSIAYVIAQHMDPKHRSMMVDLLKSDTRMEVVEAKQHQRLQAAKVYITPPGRNVTISKSQTRHRSRH